MGSGQLVRWLCWAVVILAIGSALLTLGFTFDLFGKPAQLPATSDFVDRILAVRAFDQSSWVFALANALLTLGLFLAVALLGAALRTLAPGAAGDVMAVAFAAAGIIGVVGQLANIGLSESAASVTSCDCGYKAQEVISQAKALDVGFNLQFWLSLGGIGIAGLAVALAGRLITISPTWRLLSYLIAIAAALGIALSLLHFDLLANLLFAVGLAILIPIWAILLARGTSTRETLS